jgi:hypothetical protein
MTQSSKTYMKNTGNFFFYTQLQDKTISRKVSSPGGTIIIGQYLGERKKFDENPIAKSNSPNLFPEVFSHFYARTCPPRKNQT